MEFYICTSLGLKIKACNVLTNRQSISSETQTTSSPESWSHSPLPPRRCIALSPGRWCPRHRSPRWVEVWWRPGPPQNHHHSTHSCQWTSHWCYPHLQSQGQTALLSGLNLSMLDSVKFECWILAQLIVIFNESMDHIMRQGVAAKTQLWIQSTKRSKNMFLSTTTAAS